jgi:hypothetical protein
MGAVLFLVQDEAGRAIYVHCCCLTYSFLLISREIGYPVISLNEKGFSISGVYNMAIFLSAFRPDMGDIVMKDQARSLPVS